MEPHVEQELSSRLFTYGALESRNELDECLEGYHALLLEVTANLSESEVCNQLNQKVSRSSQDHEETALALLYSILTESTGAAKAYNTLTLVSRDSFVVVVAMMERIIMEYMFRMKEPTRLQLLWLTREMVKTGISAVDRIVFALLKQIPAGSVNGPVIYVAEALLHILLDHRDWLENQPVLMTSVLYTFISTLPGHNLPSLSTLQDQEAELCVSLLRNKLMECVQIGRDLLRLLQSVSRIPAFSELWREMLHHPQDLTSQFTGISEILSKRTSRRFIAGRILADTEIKLNFLLNKVKFGQHKIYQEWFQKKVLSTPESLHLIPELIRFICCVIHPPNEVLCSDVVPRWAVIGWLLSLCQSNPVVLSNAKLALFYDWLAYDPESDSIMTIEPGVLLMFHSLRSHPQITASLLDFLLRLMPNFCPSIGDLVDRGVRAALNDILHKEVLLSLEPLFDSSRLHDDLRSSLRTTFPEYFQQVPCTDTTLTPAASTAPHPMASYSDEVTIVEIGVGQASGTETEPILIENIAVEPELEEEDAEIIAAFSDDAEEEVASEVVADFVTISEEDSKLDVEVSSMDLWCEVDGLPQRLRDKLLEFKEDSSYSVAKYSAVDCIQWVRQSHMLLSSSSYQLLEDVLDTLDSTSTEFTLTDSEISVAVSAISQCLHDDFNDGCIGDTSHDERTSYRLFRWLGEKSTTFHNILSNLQLEQPRVGYFYLYYLYRILRPEDRKHKYIEFVLGCDVSSLQNRLLKDLKTCVDNEPPVFYELLPALCREFSPELVGCVELINLAVTHIDPSQLCRLMHQLMMKIFLMFGKSTATFQTLISQSLQWDSFEQFCMWQLLNAEGPDCHIVIPAFTWLHPDDHPEAISSALLFLKTESSLFSGVGALLSLPSHLSVIIDAAGSRWVNNRPERYGKFISQYISSLMATDDNLNFVSLMSMILENLQRLANKYLNSRQVFEVSDKMLARTLQKVFITYAELSTRYEDLHKLVTNLQESSIKESGSLKRAVTTVEENRSKAQSKMKRRRVVNIDDLTD